MPKTIFARNIKSEMFKVRPLVNEALKSIVAEIPKLSEGDKCELKLILSELLYNAVIHGNKSSSNKKVFLDIKLDRLIIEATIRDDGDGFDYDGFFAQLNEEDNFNSEHGRGIKLVYALTNKLEFNDRGNSIKFYKKVSLDE